MLKLVTNGYISVGFLNVISIFCYIYLLCMHVYTLWSMWRYTHTHHGTCGSQKTTVGVRSLPLPCGSWELNSGLEASTSIC